MIPPSADAPPLLSSDAQEKQNLYILPKIKKQAYVAKTALNVDVAKDGNQAGMGHITTFDISPPWY